MSREPELDLRRYTLSDGERARLFRDRVVPDILLDDPAIERGLNWSGGVRWGCGGR